MIKTEVIVPLYYALVEKTNFIGLVVKFNFETLVSQILLLLLFLWASVSYVSWSKFISKADKGIALKICEYTMRKLLINK